MSTIASAPAHSTNAVKVDKKSLLEYLGYRITIELDDRSVITGRLVSLSPTGNLILTDPERERVVKRRRNDDGTHKRVSECYDAVLFIRSNCIISVRYHMSIVNDKTVNDCIGSKQDQAENPVKLANANPAMPNNREPNKTM